MGTSMWQEITAAPSDRDVEVAVIDKDGEHPLVVPCRRTLDGWIDARIAAPPRHSPDALASVAARKSLSKW